MKPIAIARWLARETDTLVFRAPTACTYNPLVYARRSHEAYLSRYARQGVEALLLGMNPGPWGMAQTGVPFGEVELVRTFLGIEARVDQPPRVHPQRPIEGFACTRSEVSGRRVWGWVQDRFGSADAFSDRFLVANYCPLVFMGRIGRHPVLDREVGREQLVVVPEPVGVVHRVADGRIDPQARQHDHGGLQQPVPPAGRRLRRRFARPAPSRGRAARRLERGVLSKGLPGAVGIAGGGHGRRSRRYGPRAGTDPADRKEKRSGSVNSGTNRDNRRCFPAISGHSVA
jgi:hypothetical protein